MDLYQEKALGKTPESETEAEEAAQHKIGDAAVAVLLIAAIILDIISCFEVPIADILAWIIEIPILLYLYYAGASQLRQVAANVITWLAELVPAIDLLPLYSVGIIIVIVLDRNETLARIASKIPQTKSASGALASGGGKAGSNLSKNKFIGAASQKGLDKAQQVQDRVERLQQRVPGRLRALAQGKTSEGAVTSSANSIQQVGITRNPTQRSDRTVFTSQNAQFSGQDKANAPFPDTYYNYEKELLPELSDVENIDVSGEKNLSIPRPGVGREAPKQL